MLAFERQDPASAIKAKAPRVLIYAPAGRDAEVLAEVAHEIGADSAEVRDPAVFAEQLSRDCATLVLTEEALDHRTENVLRAYVEEQPPWSALPILALLQNATRLPPGLACAETLSDRFELVVLQRPTQVKSLKSTLCTLIGSRARQYQVRDQLEDLAQKESHLRFLLSELDHRAKNLLAKVLGILNLARKEAGDLDRFSTTFSERIRALSRAHDLLNERSDRPGTLYALVESIMAPYRNETGLNIRIDGPEIDLWAQAGLALAMALHELATNASKYGALSNEDGIVMIHWHLEDGTLVLNWEERNGPPLLTPIRSSFGTRLIKSLTPMEVGGEAALTFRKEGLQWTLRAPIPQH